MSYDPQSTDSMFSTILAELRELKIQTARIEDQTTKTNGRVSRLESWQTDIKARIAVIALAVSGAGTVVVLLIDHIWKL